MNYCSKCGNELQDNMQFCPSCGTSTQLNGNEMPVGESVFVEEKSPKRKHRGIIAGIIILALLAGVWTLYSGEKADDTYNKFVDLYNTMAEGGSKAETANILVLNVWRNSIYRIDDEETDKYTKENNGSGKFYDDFNDALANLYADQKFTDDLEEIYALRAEAESLIKDLSKHPRAFDEEYADFKDCYNYFVKFTNMSLTGEGSLNSFTDEHNELDKELASKMTQLNIYFD